MSAVTDISQRRGAVIKCIAGELPRIVTEAESALLKAGSIFQRGGQLVRVCQLDGDTHSAGIKRLAGSHIIQPVTRDFLTLSLARAATWKKFDRQGNARATDPPSQVSAALMSAVGEWRFPVLSGLITAPTLRADGSLLDKAGYDASSGLYGAFDASAFPSINARPSIDDAMRALEVLDDLFNETAFSGGRHSAHSAVAIAATITAAVRHAVSIAPAFGISAHKQGSGKTTLASAIAHISLGREPPVLALSDDENELKKCLLAILIAGDACVVIDNISKPVESATLCALLTSAVYSDRILGVSTKVTVPTASTWLLTGNHLEFVGDLTTRVLLSVLDPECEHPEARPFKRDLAEYVATHRGELLAAALTIPLAYFAAGSPSVDEPRSRFSDWDRFVRRPLLWLGYTDPLKTQDELRSIDPVRESLVAVLNAWQETFNAQPASVAEAIAAANAPGQLARPQLLDALQAVAGEKDGSINSRRLGRYLTRNLRSIENGKRLEDAGNDLITNRKRFRVFSVTSVTGVSFNPSRENSDLRSKSETNTDNAGNEVEGVVTL